MKTINLYQFEELSPDAQKRALEAYRDERNRGWDSYDNQQVEEAIRETAKEQFGVDPEEVEFSLGYCQGDGVAFYGKLKLETLGEKHEDLKPLLEKLGENGYYYLTVNRTNHRYTHHNTMRLQEVSCLDEKEWEQLEASVTEILSLASKACESVGYKAIEAMLSDDSLKDELEANEVWFLESGKLFRE